MSAPAPAPTPPNPSAHTAPVPRPARNSTSNSSGPVDSGNSGKARDILQNAVRIDNFKEIPRLTCESLTFSTDFIARLVALTTILIGQVWNQGANGIDPIAAGANAAANQIARLARNFVHHFFVDLYVGIRTSVQSLDPTIFFTEYLTILGSTGQNYPTLFADLYSLLMPIVANRALAEVCYIPTWEFDQARAHNNWFEIPNVNANDISARRFGALIDVFKRSKSIGTTSLKVGTKFGSAAALIDFWPLDQIERANSWLYMDNNFNDKDLTIMYILGTNIFDSRQGPRFTFPPTPTENDRDAYTAPFHSGVTENEDVTEADTDYIDDTVDPKVIKSGNVYNRTIWFYVSTVLRDISPFLQEQAFNVYSKA